MILQNMMRTNLISTNFPFHSDTPDERRSAVKGCSTRAPSYDGEVRQNVQTDSLREFNVPRSASDKIPLSGNPRPGTDDSGDKVHTPNDLQT